MIEETEASELTLARLESAPFDLEHPPEKLTDPTITYILGLADRCADPNGGPLPIAKELHTAVSQCAMDSLVDNWSEFARDERRLAAVLHRLSWTLQNRESDLTHTAADLARVAEGMHRFPHALLTLRSSGLVYSKEDRYVPAWLTFAELRARLTRFEDTYRTGVSDRDTISMYREVQQQALLAETGTAARTVERILMDWGTDATRLSSRWQRLLYHEAFGTLRRGVLTGSLAADEVATLQTAGPKSVTKAAIGTWHRRPGVMTARCHLELATLARVVQSFGLKQVPPPYPSWDAFVDDQMESFARHYHAAHSSPAISFDDEHVRELVQLRLHAALLAPDRPFDPVEDRPGDAIAIPSCLLDECPGRDDLAAWLQDGNHNANLALSITAPAYLAWMQQMSGDESLLDWMFDAARDPLRRDTDKLPDGRRVLPAERRPVLDAAHDEAKEIYRSLIATAPTP